MDVASGSYDALLQLDDTFWSDENTSRRAFDISAVPHGGVNAERDRISESQLDLAGRSCRSEHADRRQHPPPRADDHHRLFGRVKAVLIQGLFRNQFRAGAKQDFDMLVGQVAVSRGDAHYEVRLLFAAAALSVHFRRRNITAARQHDLAHYALNGRAIKLCCGAHGFVADSATTSFTSAAARRLRQSAVISLSVTSTSMSGSSHNCDKLRCPNFVLSATTITSSALVIIARSVSTRSRLLL